MADPEVKLKFMGSEADALRAITALERKLEGLDQSLRQLSRRSKDVMDFKKMFEEMGAGALEAVGPLALAREGVTLLKNEYQAMIELQDKAKGANVDFARSLQNLALNTDTPLADVKTRLFELSRQARMAPADLANILNEAQAAKGQLDEKAVDPTIIAAARVAKFDPEMVKNLVGVSLDMQKQIDGVTAEQTLGFALNASAKSRVADPTKFAKNVLPAIIGINKLDNTSVEFATALSAGITQAAGDTEGRKSRTAMTALAIQLRSAFPELRDTESRVRALQENPELRNAFLNGGTVNGKKLSKMKFDVTGPDGQVLQLDTDHASFERQMQPAMEQVLTKGTFADKMMNESLRVTPKLADSAASYSERAAGMASDPNMKIAEQDNLFNIRTKQNLVENTTAAESSVMREGLKSTLKSLGYGDYEVWASGYERFAAEMTGSTTKDATLSILKDYEIESRGEERDGVLPANRRHIPAKLTSLIEELQPDQKTRENFAFRDESAGLPPSIALLKEALEENTKATREATNNTANGGNKRPVNRNGNTE
jgi:hypothetical protein